MEPDPEKLESVPPEMVISASEKSEEGSESVKVSVVVSPALREERVEVRAMTGLTVLMERVRELLVSSPSLLKIPLLEKALLPTSMTPSMVLLASGVKVAV